MSLLDCHCKTLFQQGASWGLGCTARISSSIRSFPAKVDIQQLKCISVEWWISSLFICYLLLFCQFSWARLCTAMQVLFQPRRESMLLLQWVSYFFIMNMKKVELDDQGTILYGPLVLLDWGLCVHILSLQAHIETYSTTWAPGRWPHPSTDPGRVERCSGW